MLPRALSGAIVLLSIFSMALHNDPTNAARVMGLVVLIAVVKLVVLG